MAKFGTARRVNPKELPAPGYPLSEDAVGHWFHQRYGRAPSEHELGAIIDEMAQREATPPHRGPRASAQGSAVGPYAAPVMRG